MKAQVKVIGSGGIGLCLLPTLSRVLNYGSHQYQFEDPSLGLVDGDNFESRNQSRQGFKNFGNKAESWVEENKETFPNVQFEAIPYYLDEDNIALYLQDGDIVFCAVDNHSTRKLVSEHCSRLKDVSLISGGNNLIDGSVMVYLRRDGQDVTLPLHAAKTPAGQKYHPEILNPPEDDYHPNDVPRGEGCMELAPSTPQLLIANNMAAALMLTAFHGLITGTFEGGYKGLFHFDDAHFDIRSSSVKTFNHTGKVQKVQKGKSE